MGAQVPVGRWALSHDASSLAFRIRRFWRHPTGRFGDVACVLEAESGSLRLTGSADVGSIATGIPLRDRHLRSRHFFDRTRHPTITFDVSGVAESGLDDVLLEGDVRIKGRTGRVELTSTLDVQSDRVVLRGRAGIDRKELGVVAPAYVEMGGLMLGRRVQVRLEGVFLPESSVTPSLAGRGHGEHGAEPIDASSDPHPA